MKLNIIILTYNCLDKIKQCLNSIYKHTKHDFDIFMIENNSIDETVKYLKKITLEKNNLYLSLQKENLGIIKGRNAGFDFYKSMSNSKDDNYIIFLDSDQYVQEGWLNSYLELMKDYDLVSCEAWAMRSSDFYPYKRITNKEETFNYVGAGSLMLKSEVFEELGLFDEDYEFIYYEDPHLCFTAYSKGYRIGWNYNPVIEHQKHNLSLSGDRKRYFMSNWRKFREKWTGKEMPVFRM